MLSRIGLGRVDTLLLAWTLVAKLAVLAIGVIGFWWAVGDLPASPVEPWDRWDAPHYTDIAVFGYTAHDPGTLTAAGYEQAYPGDLDLYIVFFPLYPWLVALANLVVREPSASALLVSTVASLFVAPILWRLVAVDLGHRVALWSAALLLVFPTAYFLHIGYTESLFLALAFGSLWLARTERWWAAGMLGGLAAMTRINGLVLLPALLVEAWLQWRTHRRLEMRWLAVGGVAVGFGIYLALNLAVYADPFAFTRIQHEHWFKQLSPPWEGIGGMFAWIGSDDADIAFMLGWMELGFVLLGLVATFATAMWLRPTWAAWMAGNWLLMVSTGLVMSVPRYALVLFGIVVWGAIAAERWRWAGWGLVAVSALAMGYFAGRFAAGQWAF